MEEEHPSKEVLPRSSRPTSNHDEESKSKSSISKSRSSFELDQSHHSDHRFKNDFRIDTMVQSVIMQPQRRRKGLKRINTSLKILLDEPGQPERENEHQKESNDGLFNSHGKEYVFDKHSLFIFRSEWGIRKMIVWIIVWPWFDYFILSCILANSINLAMYDYSKEENSNTNFSTTTDILETCFSTIFLLEAILKIVGMGFMTHKNSYMREGWNILDFIVVIVSIVDFIPSIPSLKSLRVLRVLRPLRSINAIPSMRILVSTLFISIPHLGSVVIFLLFIFLLFGIMGINQYSGVMYNQ